MPNARRPGWATSTYSAPRELIDAAKARAAEQGETVSAVIRAALEDYTQKAPDPR